MIFMFASNLQQSAKQHLSMYDSYKTGIFWILAVFLLAFIFYDSLAAMVEIWTKREEYSHAFFIPIISAYLIWNQRERLLQAEPQANWLGIFILLGGLFLYLLGELSTLHIIVQYAFLTCVYGLFWAQFGWRGIKILWAPLLFLIFMIPLPPFLYNNLSAKLQLISSMLGVQLIQWCDISVYREGNVIDLGTYQLQVAEACSGLRYLFPFASLSFLMAYLFKGPAWQRAVIFFSSAPITIFMNSLRIGIIGILVEYWGIWTAEGFLHDFEGWAIFMVCTLILLGEMLLFARLSGNKAPLAHLIVLPLSFRMINPPRAPKERRPNALWAALPVLGVAALISTGLSQRVEIPPEREAFFYFPAAIPQWEGQRGQLRQTYLNSLKLDDYLLADYVHAETGRPVNLYIAYYASQRKGVSSHSPRSCIPGGGWEMGPLARRLFPEVKIDETPLAFNRVVIQRGEQRQLVYYWFQQRGRIITNEYLVKWYLFWDALKRNRTDGAMVRLMTPIEPGEDIAVADKRLERFTKTISDLLTDYIPS